MSRREPVGRGHGRLRAIAVVACVVSAGWWAPAWVAHAGTPPGPVTGLTATPGTAQATISWTAPTTGDTVVTYVITALYGGTLARNSTAIPGTSTSVTMTGLAGTSYKFSVYGSSASGNGTAVTTATAVTVTGGSHYAYADTVLSDSPSLYYRLDESSGATALDSSGTGNSGNEVAAPTQAATSLLSTDADGALTLNGSTQYLYSGTSGAGSNTFSLEAWFKTSTASGGKIIGFGSAQTGNSGSYDRQVYMSNAGQVYFGVYPGAVKTIKSTAAYNDGRAHHVVATLSTGGMVLYVDGLQVASDPTTTTAQAYNGYWRIGEDNLSGWTAAPTSYFLSGTVDDVAIYPTALSATRVQAHYCAGANPNCLMQVQSGAEATSATGNVTPTLPVASTAGTLLVAVVANEGGSSSFPFSGPTGWVNATGLWQSGNGRSEIWYYPNNPGGISSAAFTSSATSIGATGQLSEWSGAAASGVLDQVGTVSVTTAATSATVSTSAATAVGGDLGVTTFSTSSAETSYTAGSGWTHLFTDPTHSDLADYAQALPVAVATETETAASTSADWVGLVATFKPLQLPGAVSALAATAGSDQATVTWALPATGMAASRFVVTALSGGTVTRNTTAVSGETRSITLTGLAGSTAYKFSVNAVGSSGNGATVTTAASVTITGSAYPYTADVFADSPTLYYRLDESAGTTALDSSGNGAMGTEVASPAQASAGLLSTDPDSGLALNGSTQYVYTNSSYANPTTFSLEAWFKTSSATGGRIIGFGSSQTGNSSSYDRQVYMANTGQVYFGVYPGSVVTINSTGSYNDDVTHHVVATLSTAGMFLYIDGAQVASNTTTTTAQSYTGYWRVGEDNLNTWTSAPTSYFFNGTIDEAAVYPTALSLQRVQVHYCGGANVNCLSITQPASVAFPGATINGTNQTVSASGTFDVIDNSGGTGWNETASSTVFTTGTHSMSATATSVLGAPAVSCNSGWTCTVLTNTVSYPYTVPVGSATKLFAATTGTGQGHQTLTFTFTLSLPGNSYAGSYASTWTFSTVSGP